MKNFKLIFMILFTMILPQITFSQGAGNALEFDGLNDYVEMLNSLDIGTGSSTVELWVNVPTVGTGNLTSGERVGIILGNYISTSNNNVVNLEIYSDGFARFYRKVDDNNKIQIYGTTDLRDSKWHHLAFVRNTTTNKLIIYVDGILDASNNDDGDNFTMTVAPRLGADKRGSSTPYFHGSIDEVSIWNVALTQSQIQEIMNKKVNSENLPSGISWTNLNSYWHFNETTVGSGSAIDSKGTNNGTPTNMDNSDCVVSTAPIGDECHTSTGTSNLGESACVPVDISWDAGGDPGTDAIFSAIQVNEIPAVTTGLLANKADKYWELWIENDDGNYQSDITFHFDCIGGIDDETELKLYKRSCAGGVWSEINESNITRNYEGNNTDGIGSITVNNCTSFCQFIITSPDGDNNELPIELINFSANCKTQNIIELNWQTASEINNSYFEIQQSYDTDNFKTIGKVQGAGNSNEILNYNYVVENNENLVTYYRLKQIDFDGKYSFSKTISVNCNQKQLNNIEVYPNPFSNTINIGVCSNVRVQIRNSLGIIISEKEIEGNNSNYTIMLNKELPVGIYYVVIYSKEETIVRKLLKE